MKHKQCYLFQEYLNSMQLCIILLLLSYNKEKKKKSHGYLCAGSTFGIHSFERVAWGSKGVVCELLEISLYIGIIIRVKLRN